MILKACWKRKPGRMRIDGWHVSWSAPPLSMVNDYSRGNWSSVYQHLGQQIARRAVCVCFLKNILNGKGCSKPLAVLQLTRNDWLSSEASAWHSSEIHSACPWRLFANSGLSETAPSNRPAPRWAPSAFPFIQLFSLVSGEKSGSPWLVSGCRASDYKKFLMHLDFKFHQISLIWE